MIQVCLEVNTFSLHLISTFFAFPHITFSPSGYFLTVITNTYMFFWYCLAYLSWDLSWTFWYIFFLTYFWHIYWKIFVWYFWRISIDIHGNFFTIFWWRIMPFLILLDILYNSVFFSVILLMIPAEVSLREFSMIYFRNSFEISNFGNILSNIFFRNYS